MRVADQPLVSVVTPFHNTARHLRECVESVLAQSYKKFEYILYDNASTDDSGVIAREYAAVDKRIRYIRSGELLPQVPNYNRALLEISSDSLFTKIVQADDWIFPECLELMVDLGLQHPRVGIVSSYRMVGSEIGGVGLPYSTRVAGGREIARSHLLSRLFLFGSATTILVRSEVVRSRRPFYEVGRLQDTETCYQILQDWDFGFVHQILSFTRVDEDSTHGRMQLMDGGALDFLIVAHRFAPLFLDPKSASQCIAGAERNYYRRLARGLLRGPQYWEYHSHGRATQGISLDRSRVAAEALRAVIGAAVPSGAHAICGRLRATSSKRSSRSEHQ
jgi:glycosyltransferase involved in cell wall biosynthesis